MNITVRNIPEEVVSKIKTISGRERRSLNSEILWLLENALDVEEQRLITERRFISKEQQVATWEKLCGAWEDERTSEEIVADIVEKRTLGREVEL